MIRRPSDCWPPALLDEYRRLAALSGLPVNLTPTNDQSKVNFRCQPVHESMIWNYCTSGQDYAGTIVATRWLAEGPKIADITEEQYQALAQVEVRLEVKDFTTPFPTVLVNMPPGKMHSYVILHRGEVPTSTRPLPIIIAISCSPCHRHDIVTVVRQWDSHHVEESLAKYTSSVEDYVGEACHASLRVTCNLLLAMTNFGSYAKYLFPQEVERERKYITKGDRPGKNGRTSTMRLAEQPMVVVLDRDVKLWHREGVHTADNGHTGHKMPFHWRRGHWAKRHIGPRTGTETKVVFVKPCMVRGDLLLVDKGETTTRYV